MRTFTKTGSARPHAIEIEALCLRCLAEAMPYGGTPVVPILDCEPGRMTLVEVPNVRPTRQAAYRCGQTLAVTHATGAPTFGCPPPGWEGNGVIGRMELPLRQPPQERSTRRTPRILPLKSRLPLAVLMRRAAAGASFLRATGFFPACRL